jgi:hypothetical protein
MKDFIKEALLTEAANMIAKQVKAGKVFESALEAIADELCLESDEVAELKTRAKKVPTPKVVEDEGDMGFEDLPDETGVSDHTIEFTNPDDLEAAVGVLMYKGIPWINKGTNFMVFDGPDSVAKAQEALNRRWDFVNHEDRTVAFIEFDNLEDYKKVLDFIASKKMAVMLGRTGDLAGDLDQEIEESLASHNNAKKEAKKAGLPAPEMPSHAISYKALRKDAQLNLNEVDAAFDRPARAMRVVKRWK